MIDQITRSEIIGLVVPLIDLTERIGLKHWEVEALIAVHRGVWPLSPSRRDMWWPTELQAECVRALFEICLNALEMMGHEASGWLRRRNAGLGQSPIGYLLGRPSGLLKMRDILAWEAGRC